MSVTAEDWKKVTPCCTAAFARTLSNPARSTRYPADDPNRGFVVRARAALKRVTPRKGDPRRVLAGKASSERSGSTLALSQPAQVTGRGKAARSTKAIW